MKQYVQMCYSFNNTGHCVYQDKCRYYHDRRGREKNDSVGEENDSVGEENDDYNVDCKDSRGTSFMTPPMTTIDE